MTQEETHTGLEQHEGKLKGYSAQKCKFSHHLLILMLSQMYTV